ncbi:MAG: glycoside hydrolase family 99-like domain-containing protein [Lachnospiraceae bacterium]|nr:glycoside hydrolase family 99-like domain-containing protein [Lachnospiraceae bacterium]
MRTKIIAYYLPQFHRVKENDEWWGKNFTEWTNVKKAISLFEGHYQPFVPMNRNYYNLMDKDTVKWQTDIAKEYGVHGFAYYHYWFKGKMFLEKPAENLLVNKDIRQRFFFFWANHTWYKAVDGKKHELMKQTYGQKEDWIEHYTYMRQFFLDDRYICHNNRPLIGIYIPKDIPCYNEMIDTWNNLAIKDGFDGVYIIESINSDTEMIFGKNASAGVIRQPNISRIKYKRPDRGIMLKLYKAILKIKIKLLDKSMFSRYDYKLIIEKETSENATDYSSNNKEVFYGISTGWDNTARHGKNGQVMVDVNPENFKTGFKKLYIKSIAEDKEYLFINAWNEWAEGMYLEPDEKYKYGFLEAIRETIEEVGEKI